MQAPMRRHHTKDAEIIREEVTNIDWRTSLADIIEKYTEGGAALKGLRLREDLTQVEMAKKLGITQANLSSMERGKRPIGKNMAKRLGELFHISYKLFL